MNYQKIYDQLIQKRKVFEVLYKDKRKDKNLKLRGPKETYLFRKTKPCKDLSNNVEEILDLYLTQYKNPEEIGKIFNCSHGPIKRILRENGIKLRGQSEIRSKKLYKVHK
jgi:intein-encoded DNA endonuclease-like protein